MAKGVINLQKELGGVTKITSTDGTGITEVVLPESGELVNKAYVDDVADLKVALADFIGSNQNLTTSGYQKLPGGLIIQWVGVNANKGQAYNFPITFPNSCLFTCANHPGMDISANPTVYDATPSQFKLSWSLTTNPLNQQVFSIGC